MLAPTLFPKILKLALNGKIENNVFISRSNSTFLGTLELGAWINSEASITSRPLADLSLALT